MSTLTRARHGLNQLRFTRNASSSSSHAQWYKNTLPAMVPVALLGSAVYLGLQLAQVHLSTAKQNEEATAKIHQLELELHALQTERDARVIAQQPLKEDKVKTRRWWFAQV